MARFFYTFAMVGLIGSTAWTATGVRTDRHDVGAGMGIVIVAALQR